MGDTLSHIVTKPHAEKLFVRSVDGIAPEIGRWLWALEEVRSRTLRIIGDLDQRLIDWEGHDGRENSIGSLLYHIADVEMGWLWGEILERTEMPPEILGLLPFGNESGCLARVTGRPLSEHISLLGRTRTILRREMAGISLEEWRRLRLDPTDREYEATPEWVIFHLIEHEAMHTGQISSLKARGRRCFE